MKDYSYISIIVPVRNAERTLDKTFNYLLNINYPRDKMEIIMSDGGSTDSTISVIKQWQKEYSFIKLVEIPNCPSPAFARNKALEIVKGEFIFFTDGDCAPCKEWVTEMLKHFYRDENIGAVGGEIYTLKVDKDNLTEAYCENFRFNMVAPRYGFIKEGYFPDFKDFSPSEIVGHRAYFFVTANVSYRKKAIEKINLHFWKHPTGEDIDFCLTLHKAGWKLYFAPKAKVDHMHRADFKALKKVWVTYGQAHPPLLQKHSKDVLEIVFQFISKKPSIRFSSKTKGLIYIGNFHLMHIFGFLFVVTLLFSIFSSNKILWIILTATFFIAGIGFAFRFFSHCFNMNPRKHFFTWAKMKYMTNLCFLKGGLKGKKKYKAFCIEPSF